MEWQPVFLHKKHEAVEALHRIASHRIALLTAQAPFFYLFIYIYFIQSPTVMALIFTDSKRHIAFLHPHSLFFFPHT